MRARAETQDHIDFARYLDPEKYVGLENLSALDWYIQIAARRHCFEIAERWKREPGEYPRVRNFMRRVQRLLAQSPILSIPKIRKCKFTLYDFDLRFYCKNLDGNFQPHRIVQPVRYRDLSGIRNNLLYAARNFFCCLYDGDISWDMACELADEWMAGKRDLPYLPGVSENPIAHVGLEAFEYIMLDTTPCNDNMIGAVRGYQKELQRRGALGGENTRAPKTMLSRNGQPAIQSSAGMVHQHESRGDAAQNKNRRLEPRDAYSVWVKFRMLPCMDLLLRACLTPNIKPTNELIAEWLSNRFPEDDPWSVDKVKATRGHISRLLHPCSRLYGELERAAMDELERKLSSPEFKESADIIEEENRRWMEHLCDA